MNVDIVSDAERLGAAAERREMTARDAAHELKRLYPGTTIPGALELIKNWKDVRELRPGTLTFVLTVITGAPCSGKTRYVQQHALPDDIVVDFDQIAQALGSQVGHGHTDRIASVASRAWYAAVCEAIAQHHHGYRAWIIDSAPNTSRRKQYDAAGARTVTCTAPAEELHRRAEGNRPPTWHARIDQWLAREGHDDPSPRPRTRW